MNLASEHFKDAIRGFLGNVENFEAIPFGSGHINGTYKITVDKNHYILQNINGNVFHNPQKVMDNIQRITRFLRKKTADNRATLNFLTGNDGTICYVDKYGNSWRMYEFIDNARGVDRPTLEEFYECAVGFGRFQSQLSDFPADTLFETIPDFHNTPKRYKKFLDSVAKNASGRLEAAAPEVEFVNARKDFYSTLIDAQNQGILPLRVSHNDTKCNNVLLDDKTHKAVCVIDLDTIMPGYSVTDFGDAVRFGASTADEDEKDLSLVHFDLEKFRIFAKGFIEGCDGKLPKEEIMLLPEGALMMTLECGMRFLTDFIDGDIYFKTEYPEHNLVRCRTQLKLAEEMEATWDEMKKAVAELQGDKS